MTVVGGTSRSTYTEDKDNKRKKCARTAVATYTVMHRIKTGDTAESTVVVDLAEPSRGQRVEDRVGSARKNAEQLESRPVERMTGLHVFVNRRGFLGSEVADCAVRWK